MFPVGPILAKANDEKIQSSPHVGVHVPFAQETLRFRQHYWMILNVSSHICEVFKHLVSFCEPPKSFVLSENHKKQIAKKKWRTALQWNLPILCKGANSCFASLSTVDIRTSTFTFPVLRKKFTLTFHQTQKHCKKHVGENEHEHFPCQFSRKPKMKSKWHQNVSRCQNWLKCGC